MVETAFSTDNVEGVTSIRFDPLNQHLAVAGIRGSFNVFFVDLQSKMTAVLSVIVSYTLVILLRHPHVFHVQVESG